MAFVGILIAALALVATISGVYYARGQLREAQRLQQQNQNSIENQKKEDDLWSEKCVRASRSFAQWLHDSFSEMPTDRAVMRSAYYFLTMSLATVSLVI